MDASGRVSRPEIAMPDLCNADFGSRYQSDPKEMLKCDAGLRNAELTHVVCGDVSRHMTSNTTTRKPTHLSQVPKCDVNSPCCMDVIRAPACWTQLFTLLTEIADYLIFVKQVVLIHDYTANETMYHLLMHQLMLAQAKPKSIAFETFLS